MKTNEKKRKEKEEGAWKELKTAPQNCEPPYANFFKEKPTNISALAKYPDLLRFVKELVNPPKPSPMNCEPP